MADIPTTAWSETYPDGDQQEVHELDTIIQEHKTQIREVVAVDHKMSSVGHASTFGYHTIIHIMDTSADPTALDGIGMLYVKSNTDNYDLFFRGYNKAAIQMTNAGVPDVRKSDAILKTSASAIQSMTGSYYIYAASTCIPRMMFSGQPSGMSSDYQMINRAVLKATQLTDLSNVGAYGTARQTLMMESTGNVYFRAPTFQSTRKTFTQADVSNAVKYQNTTKRCELITVTAYVSGDGNQTALAGYSDGNATPTTLKAAAGSPVVSNDSGAMQFCNIHFVVKPDDYYYVKFHSAICGAFNATKSNVVKGEVWEI